MSFFRTVCVFSILLIGPVVHGRTYYVGNNGDDSRGSDSATNRSTPWRTIQRGVNQARGGDRVVVLDGWYRENVYLGNSGYGGGEIVLEAENREGARLEGWISSNDQSYIIVDGFDVTNSSQIPPTKGISFVRCHHITVRDCRVRDCYGGGIAFDKTDWVLCEWNIVHNNAYFNPGQHSGISIYQPEYRGNDGRRYGIIIRNNTSFGNYNFVNNRNFNRPTDGNGIVLDDYLKVQGGGVPYDRPTLVENNLVFDNGGNGIHCFSSQNVRVRNNTVANNVGNISFAGEITTVESRRIYIYNNIAAPRPGKYAIFGYRSSGDVVFNNLVGGANLGVQNDGGIYADPRFVPGTLTLRGDSRAVNAGYNAGDHYGLDVFGQGRFRGNIDLGAIEYR